MLIFECVDRIPIETLWVNIGHLKVKIECKLGIIFQKARIWYICSSRPSLGAA